MPINPDFIRWAKLLPHSAYKDDDISIKQMCEIKEKV
jgi:hypothetical protein